MSLCSLKPIDNDFREVKSLNGLWSFCVDSEDLHEPWTKSLPGKLECPVPSSYNDIYCNPSLQGHIGKVWYQRLVRIPRSWVNKDVFLRIDAATHQGEVYVNETMVATHTGGYTPFDINLSSHEAGEPLRITIGVSNILTRHSIPPGDIVTDMIGGRSQKIYHDFFNYCGLSRNVSLVVEDITVRTDIEGHSGVVGYSIDLCGAASVQVDLLHGDSIVGHVQGPNGRLIVPEARFWQPGEGFMYDLRVRLRESSAVLDEYTLPIGIRTVQVDGFQLLINQKPFYLKGFATHEDAPIIGRGHNDTWMVHDFELMQWCGANSFRTSHYPYAEEVYEYADRHGIVIIDETAAVGLNLKLRTPEDPRSTFGSEFADGVTQEAHRQAISELFRRDKNHPSVVMWSIANEPESQAEGAREYFEPLVEHARKLDPTRPILFTNMPMATHETDQIADLFDVIALNRYWGWYVDTGNLALAEHRLETELNAWADRYKKPLMMLEYGVDTIAGLHSEHSQPWSEEYQIQFLQTYHRVFDRVEAFQGEHVWVFADFATGPGVTRVDGNRKGVFTRERRPKAAAYMLRQRWGSLMEKMSAS